MTAEGSSGDVDVPAITDADVTVVISGAVRRWTRAAILSTRSAFPNSEIIFSSWRGAVPDTIRDLVDVVESPDPGAGPPQVDSTGVVGVRPNLNRTIVSTSAGIAAAHRPYVIAVRSDMPFEDAGALQWQHLMTPGNGTLFRRRVITSSVVTRPSTEATWLHHPSDRFHFGLRDDLADLWSTDLRLEAASVQYWDSRPRPAHGNFAVRYASEQIIWLDFLQRHGVSVDYEDCSVPGTPARRAESDLRLVENFVVLEPWQLGVTFPKLAPMLRTMPPELLLSYSAWAELDALHARRGAR